MVKTQQAFLTTLLVSVLLINCSVATMPTRLSSMLDAAKNVYDILDQNNLPRGFLPRGVQSYSVTPKGQLDVTLADGCTFVVQNYKMQFAADISGIIKSGSIGMLHGFSMQVKYVWLGITHVDRFGDQLTLTIQQNSKIFLPISSFAQSPTCT